MQWILQEFEDTRKLAEALDRLELPYTWHKVIPFVGELSPKPEVADASAVVMFGSYVLWRSAEANGFRPAVFRLRPFVLEASWRPHMLNGPDAMFLAVGEVPERLEKNDSVWFLRPVADSKELAGGVHSSQEIVEMARKVLALDPQETPEGSLRHDTMLMLTRPVRILKEWRVWVVNGRVVTYSLYKEGARVVYRNEVDDDALAFAQMLADLNPSYSPAYVMDICRVEGGLRLLETNCINAAGFYAADLLKLAAAIDGMPVQQDTFSHPFSQA